MYVELANKCLSLANMYPKLANKIELALCDTYDLLFLCINE